jgi:putative chitinase
MPNLTSGALEESIVDHNQLAYVIATAEWETAHFETMEEYYNSRDDLNQAYDGEIGNGAYPSNDGFTYRGRGYVQLTGRANYATMGSLLGIDLIDNPDQAEDLFIAGEIAAIGMHQGLFTGVDLGNYISGPSVDFVGARSIINDQDQAATIAGYASNFGSTLSSCAGGMLK